MNLKPLGDRIIVKQDEAQETTAGGLYIAPDSKEKPQTGVVLAAVSYTHLTLPTIRLV